MIDPFWDNFRAGFVCGVLSAIIGFPVLVLVGRGIRHVFCFRHMRLKMRGVGCGSCMVDRYYENVTRRPL